MHKTMMVVMPVMHSQLIIQLNIVVQLMAAAVMDPVLLQTNSSEIAFVNMFIGNHAITTNGIATMNLSIATKNVADKCHSTIKSSAAAMFHSIIAKLAADMCLSTTTHATAHTVQNTLVNVAANTFQNTTTNALAALQIPAAQQDLINNHRVICQAGGWGTYLSVSLF